MNEWMNRNGAAVLEGLWKLGIQSESSCVSWGRGSRVYRDLELDETVLHPPVWDMAQGSVLSSNAMLLFVSHDICFFFPPSLHPSVPPSLSSMTGPLETTGPDSSTRQELSSLELSFL